jgi:hypothetical protein
MAVKTLCPIKDIKGWHHYDKCPYTKSLFSKAGVSDVLSTSGRKERFFKALQKNVGRDGHLTKDVMKRTLGDFMHEIDSTQFYKLSSSIFPNESQRFSMGGNTSVSGKIGTNPVSGNALGDKPSSSNISKNEVPLKTDSASSQIIQNNPATFSPVRMRASVYRSAPSESGSSQEKGHDFFRSMKSTMKNRHN